MAAGQRGCQGVGVFEAHLAAARTPDKGPKERARLVRLEETCLRRMPCHVGSNDHHDNHMIRVGAYKLVPGQAAPPPKKKLLKQCFDRFFKDSDKPVRPSYVHTRVLCF